MTLSPDIADRLRSLAAMLDRYIARHSELVAEVAEQTARAAASEGYEQMRAANDAKAAKAKIALYEPEIELLRHQLERMAVEAGLMSPIVPTLPGGGEAEASTEPLADAPELTERDVGKEMTSAEGTREDGTSEEMTGEDVTGEEETRRQETDLSSGLKT